MFANTADRTTLVALFALLVVPAWAADTVATVTLYKTDMSEQAPRSSRFPAKDLVALHFHDEPAPPDRGACDRFANQNGELRCRLTCDPDNPGPWEYRLKFQSISNANYVTPAPVTMVLGESCSVRPKRVRATYVHDFAWEFLTAEVKKGERAFRRQVESVTPLRLTGASDHYEVNEFTRELRQAAGQPRASDLLPAIQKQASDLSFLLQFLGNRDESNLYQEYALAAQNAMLDEIAKRYVADGVLEGVAEFGERARLRAFLNSLHALRKVIEDGDHAAFEVSAELVDATLAQLQKWEEAAGFGSEEIRELSVLYRRHLQAGA